jgi:pseudaminic acid biosynthesis-associated methylase
MSDSSSTNMNSQEFFWARDYASDYIKKNSRFDDNLGARVWEKFLINCKEISNYLELGCNIGRNIQQIKIANPQLRPSIIEISKPAYDYVTKIHEFDYSFNGPILDSPLPIGYFDLTFTMGVLIHIHPDNLVPHMQKLYSHSKKYILIGEYFNRTPVSLRYQGQEDKLFKCDFGKIFIENFNVQLVDYGFIWGHLYDEAGFDDITWWLFEKLSGSEKPSHEAST